MPRLFAPEGVTRYSHNGHEFEVANDGSVNVSDHVADDLRHHGFREAAPKTTELVSVKRSDLLMALEKLGISAPQDMTGEKLASALAAAVAKDAKKVADKPTLSLGGDKTKSA